MRSVTTVGSFRTLLSPRMAFLFFIIQRNRGEKKVQRAALVCAHTVASTRNDCRGRFANAKLLVDLEGFRCTMAIHCSGKFQDRRISHCASAGWMICATACFPAAVVPGPAEVGWRWAVGLLPAPGLSFAAVVPMEFCSGGLFLTVIYRLYLRTPHAIRGSACQVSTPFVGTCSCLEMGGKGQDLRAARAPFLPQKLRAAHGGGQEAEDPAGVIKVSVTLLVSTVILKIHRWVAPQEVQQERNEVSLGSRSLCGRYVVTPRCYFVSAQAVTKGFALQARDQIQLHGAAQSACKVRNKEQLRRVSFEVKRALPLVSLEAKRNRQRTSEHHPQLLAQRKKALSFPALLGAVCSPLRGRRLPVFAYARSACRYTRRLTATGARFPRPLRELLLARALVRKHQVKCSETACVVFLSRLVTLRDTEKPSIVVLS
ncbi:hypothetical protein Anapl_03917 [Anas platyrhynchos]|uniref:Uncharacterized protein n=1 Tax=Anas platyrhynchos TaxID=8839 RepID=R0LHK5_ANAPL|nr:hypothetical protein Anapl_03917 [Anas platyrhynchos]